MAIRVRYALIKIKPIGERECRFGDPHPPRRLKIRGCILRTDFFGQHRTLRRARGAIELAGAWRFWPSLTAALRVVAAINVAGLAELEVGHRHHVCICCRPEYAAQVPYRPANAVKDAQAYLRKPVGIKCPAGIIRPLRPRLRRLERNGHKEAALKSSRGTDVASQ
jgi:hypothetical protein